MVHSEELLDIMPLGKCEVHYTKSQYSFCTISPYRKHETHGTVPYLAQGSYFLQTW